MNRRGTENESTEFEGDRSASHNVDPLPPVEFRLFGLGGKKKKPEDEPPAPAPEETEASIRSGCFIVFAGQRAG